MDDDNDVVNLDVRGQSFLVSLSTLLSANDGCSYFNARFRPDSMLDAGLIRVDEVGRNVYEIDRDPFLFQHFMEYLVTNKLPTKIGSWSANILTRPRPPLSTKQAPLGCFMSSLVLFPLAIKTHGYHRGHKVV